VVSPGQEETEHAGACSPACLHCEFWNHNQHTKQLHLHNKSLKPRFSHRNHTVSSWFVLFTEKTHTHTHTHTLSLSLSNPPTLLARLFFFTFLSSSNNSQAFLHMKNRVGKSKKTNKQPSKQQHKNRSKNQLSYLNQILQSSN
jgi:hypothetical protein